MTCRFASVLVCIFLAAASAQAQWLSYPTCGVPRTPDGKPDLAAPAPETFGDVPDLSGIWQTNAGGCALNVASGLPAGEIQPWAASLYTQRFQKFAKDNPAYSCKPVYGPAITLGMLGTYKILQTAGALAFLPGGDYGFGHAEYRQVLLDGRRLSTAPGASWQGYSIGHWESGSMVIESGGFNDLTWLDIGGHSHTEDLHITERFRRSDFGHLQIQITYMDAAIYAKPWTISMTAVLLPDTELTETVCNENECDLRHFVVTDEDRRQLSGNLKLSSEVLSRYVGVYEVPGPGGNNLKRTQSRAQGISL